MAYDISLIICTYNQSATLGPIFNALEKELEAEGITAQIIIVDDGSTSDEAKKVLDLVTQFNRASRSSIHYVWQKDLGFRLAASRNNGLKLAETDVVIFMDGDCIPQPGFLKYHLDAHQEHGSNLVCVGHRAFQHPDGQTSEALERMERIEAHTIVSKVETPTPWRSVLGRNFSFRHTDDVIYFDERIYGWGAEDFDFAIQLCERGYDVAYESRAVVIQSHDFDESNNPYDNLDQQRLAYVQANHLLLMKKYAHLPETFVELGKFLAYYAVPFDFDGREFQLDEARKETFLVEFSAGLDMNYTDAQDLYDQTLSNLRLFFTVHPEIKNHPAMSYLEDTGTSTEPQPGHD